MHLRLGADRPPTGAQLGRRAELAALEWQRGSSVTLAILETGEDVCRGEVRVHSVDWENRRAELAVWVAVERRGAGIGGRALTLAAGWLLTGCGLERVALLTEPTNARMIGAAQAAGFSREGVLRGYALERGRRVDKVVLSRVRRDLAG